MPDAALVFLHGRLLGSMHTQPAGVLLLGRGPVAQRRERPTDIRSSSKPRSRRRRFRDGKRSRRAHPVRHGLPRVRVGGGCNNLSCPYSERRWGPDTLAVYQASGASCTGSLAQIRQMVLTNEQPEKSPVSALLVCGDLGSPDGPSRHLRRPLPRGQLAEAHHTYYVLVRGCLVARD